LKINGCAVDICRDSAKQANLMALTAPNVENKGYTYACFAG